MTTTKTCPGCKGQVARPESVTRWERVWEIHRDTCPGRARGSGNRKAQNDEMNQTTDKDGAVGVAPTRSQS